MPMTSTPVLGGLRHHGADLGGPDVETDDQIFLACHFPLTPQLVASLAPLAARPEEPGLQRRLTGSAARSARCAPGGTGLAASLTASTSASGRGRRITSAPKRRSISPAARSSGRPAASSRARRASFASRSPAPSSTRAPGAAASAASASTGARAGSASVSGQLGRRRDAVRGERHEPRHAVGETRVVRRRGAEQHRQRLALAPAGRRCRVRSTSQLIVSDRRHGHRLALLDRDEQAIRRQRRHAHAAHPGMGGDAGAHLREVEGARGGPRGPRPRRRPARAPPHAALPSSARRTCAARSGKARASSVSPESAPARGAAGERERRAPPRAAAREPARLTRPVPLVPPAAACSCAPPPDAHLGLEQHAGAQAHRARARDRSARARRPPWRRRC